MTGPSARLKARFPRATARTADFLRWHLRPRHDFGTELRYRKGLPLAALQPSDRVLEVGRCTHSTLAIARQVAHVTTCDLGQRGRSVATHGPRNLSQVHADICTTDLESESFDLVLAMAVLEHIPDDAAAVANVYRLLKPGGRFVGYVPDTAEHLAAWERGDYPDHQRPGYTPETMRRLLEAAGLEVQHCQLDNGAYCAVAGDLYYRVARRVPGFSRLPFLFVRPFMALARSDDRIPGSIRWGLFFKAVKTG